MATTDPVVTCDRCNKPIPAGEYRKKIGGRVVCTSCITPQDWIEGRWCYRWQEGMATIIAIFALLALVGGAGDIFYGPAAKGIPSLLLAIGGFLLAAVLLLSAVVREVGLLRANLKADRNRSS